jgi:hypothetical protein
MLTAIMTTTMLMKTLMIVMLMKFTMIKQ